MIWNVANKTVNGSLPMLAIFLVIMITTRITYMEKIYTETTLYSGYNTARKWDEWRDAVPDLLLKMGTSLLLKIKDGQRDAALALLEQLEETGIGERCSDGYGQIAVCHPLHAIGRSVQRC